VESTAGLELEAPRDDAGKWMTRWTRFRNAAGNLVHGAEMVQ
jgi:hypothetical protein